MSKTHTARRLRDHIEHLALNAQREETQLAASVAWLDRHEGKPIARNVNVMAGDVSQLDDATLAAIAMGEGGDDTLN